MPLCMKECSKQTTGHGLTHTIDGLWGFLAIFAFFYLFVNRWHILYGPALCASGCIIALFIGREFSDKHKLGYWDWEGLLTPSITFFVLAILISLCVFFAKQERACFAHNHSQPSSQSEDKTSHRFYKHSQNIPTCLNTLIHNCNEYDHANMDRRPVVFMSDTPYL